MTTAPTANYKTHKDHGYLFWMCSFKLYLQIFSWLLFWLSICSSKMTPENCQFSLVFFTSKIDVNNTTTRRALETLCIWQKQGHNKRQIDILRGELGLRVVLKLVLIAREVKIKHYRWGMYINTSDNGKHAIPANTMPVSFEATKKKDKKTTITPVVQIICEYFRGHTKNQK